MLASKRTFKPCSRRAWGSCPAARPHRPHVHAHAGASRPPQGAAAPGFSAPPGYAPSETHERIKQLQRDLQACVRAEDYERAAVLRRQLDELERSDPLLSLQRALKDAVAREAYAEAAQLQRQLSELEQQLAMEAQGPVPPVDLASVPTSSDCTSPPGVRVQVQSFFAPANSRPGVWVFAYKVTITNRSDKVLQLKSRQWLITDEEGHKEEVKGPGVVGAQPVLLPGKSFEYMSGCPLRCQQGTMEGSYTFVQLDEEDGTFKDQVQVKIARFRLTTQGESIM